MLAWRRMSNDDTTDPVNDHFNDPVSPDNSHTYVNPEDDNDPQLDGQTEGFSDPEPHVADVDPHQRPPSTVVDTPRDSGDTQQDTPAVSAPAPRHVNADDVMEVLGKAVDAWSEVGQDSSDRAALAASLRRMADKIEGAG
jgi:hypothetical protein